MTGDKITYGESIECPGKWRRMDYETTVKEGETEQSAGNRAQSFVQNFLSQNNPHLYQEQEIIIPEYEKRINAIDNSVTYSPQPIDNQPKKLSQQEVLEQLINDATTMKALNWLEKPAQKYPQTKELYDFKKSQLEALQ